MKDLESKLRKLPLIAPAQDVDCRILAQKPERPVKPFGEPRRVPVWMTAAVALLTAVAGFGSGVAWRSRQEVATRANRPPVMIEVIYDSPASRNPFDFTNASHFFPAGQVEITTREPGTTI